MQQVFLKHLKRELRFDDKICAEATLDDIDTKKVEWYLEERYKARKVSKSELPYEQLLVNLGAARKVNGDIRPTNAGILFFGKYPQRFFVQSPLRVVRFKGTDVTHPVLNSIDCHGTIWEMVNQAEEFIRMHVRLLSYRTSHSFRRTERFEYPLKALREAVINALIHRDYRSTADTRVFIFDDRFEVISPGTFPEGVTPDKPWHRPVNPILCSLIYDIGWIEKYGSGIPMMKRLCRQQGNKEPYYDLRSVETVIIFESPVKERTFIDIVDLTERLNERQQKAIWYIQEYGRITNREYRKIFDVAKDTAHRDLTDMVKKGIIIRKGVGPGTHYTLKSDDKSDDKSFINSTKSLSSLWFTLPV